MFVVGSFSDGYWHTISYKRMLRTLGISLDDQRVVTDRLQGRVYRFSSQTFHLISHPLICIKTARYYQSDLLRLSDYPSCETRPNLQTDLYFRAVYTSDRVGLGDIQGLFGNGCSNLVHQMPRNGKLLTNASELQSDTYYQHSGKERSDIIGVYVKCRTDERMIEISISVKPVTLVAEVQEMVIDKRETDITSNILRTESTNRNQPVFYRVLRAPTHGELTVNGASTLSKDSFFTQQEIDDNKILYVLHTIPLTNTTDSIQLTVSSLGAPDLSTTLNTLYLPSLRVVTATLELPEGSTQPLTTRHLNVAYGALSELSFGVVLPPLHGTLLADNQRVTQFTSGDISAGRIEYVHDGSESTTDNLTIHVYNSLHNVSHNLTLYIKIYLVNDNPPMIRNEDHIIRVVEGMETVLTSHDINFGDDDADQSAADILLERHGIACGDIISTETKGQVYKFTQLDVSTGKLSFHHKGMESCRLVLWASDGEHIVSGHYQVRAVEHRLMISGSKHLQVSRGGSVRLSTSTIEITTNTNATPETIVIRVTTHGQRGRLFIGDSERDSFTYADILSQSVSYHHSGAISLTDAVRIMISVGSVNVTDTIQVSIDTDISLLTPIIQSSETVFGHANASVLINSSVLSVYHSLAEQNEILYQTEHQSVNSGQFLLSEGGKDIAVDRFSQADITRGAISYQLGSKSEQLTLIVSFQGVSTDLVFRTLVIPPIIQFSVRNLTVDEGGSALITVHNILVDDPQLVDNDLSLTMDGMLRGQIYKDGETVLSCSWSDLLKGNT